MKRFFFLFLFLFLIIANVNAQDVIIYKSEACGHCHSYLEELKQYLNSKGITNIIERDVINDVKAREEWDNYNKLNNVPMELQGHLTISINNLTIEGHMPVDMLDEYFKKYPNFNFPKLILYQDYMIEKEEMESYKLMYNNQVKECSISTSVENCIKLEKDPNLKQTNKKFYENSLFWLILFTGLLAGIHPCTIAVLLFFIAFLFTIRKTRVGIFKVGLSYIIGVFLAYLLIGIGLLKAIVIGNNPHFAAQIAAYLVILLGIINIGSYFFPGLSLGIPKTSKHKITELVQKSSVPAAFILGLFVGLCSFGCTAGIYFSVLGILLNNAVSGFLYLVLYNLMFIIPLIIILILASNKRVVNRIEKLEMSSKGWVKIVSGLIMLAMGLFILYGGVLH